MALPAATTWETRTTGSDSSGGGFVPGGGGVDFSQQDAPQYQATDLAVDAVTNTNVTSASHFFGSSDLNNILHLNGGTGWTPGPYQILSATSGVATLDRSPAAAGTTGGQYAVGGALGTPGQAGALHVGGNKINLRQGTYLLTGVTPNTPGGPIKLLAGTVAAATRLTGYAAVRGDRPTGSTRPVIMAGVGTPNISVVNQTNNCVAEYLIVDGNSRVPSGVIAFNSYSGNPLVQYCLGRNTANSIFVSTSCFWCEASGGGTGFQSCFCDYCLAHDNTVFSSGFAFTHCCNCIAYGQNQGPGFSGGVAGQMLAYCTAYGVANGSPGFSGPGNNTVMALLHCLAVGNAAYGFAGSGGGPEDMLLVNCAGYGNGSGNVQAGTQTVFNFLTLTGNPLVNPPLDFSLNNLPGAGLLCRSGGLGVWPGLGATVGAPYVGAVGPLPLAGRVIGSGFLRGLAG